MKILSRIYFTESPHYSSIRNWVGRIGLYELSRQKEKRDDWIFIIDLTLELGPEKAMVIYGISEKLWREKILAEKRGLKHTDGEILGIEITKSATGEWIKNILENLSKMVGIPRQIVTDKGSNLQKGIQLYQQNNQEVISTYDVTHAMANLLKKELVLSESYQNFLTDCHQCKQQLKQTELGFLIPPSQRSQCRYFNVERLVDWATNLLNCPLDIFPDLLEVIELTKIEERLKEKFSWLNKYQQEIPLWGTMVLMTRTLEKQLKLFGLNQESVTQFSENISHILIPSSLSSFYDQIINYLKTEIEKIKDKRTILATSDVLESIFGKYKHFSKRCPLKNFRQTLLTIPLLTMNLTSELIKQALETVRCRDLSEWINEVFGQSMLSKRKAVFDRSFDDTKVA
ncbi:hypothetical protein [Floridanema evergladense]|uniref:DUF659 domain-containing protein n=1 Tax=Floridaenema evergladense BLCC-F167 TaxID=3153639 RepID=A0ABV4WHW2_9CYAN